MSQFQTLLSQIISTDVSKHNCAIVSRNQNIIFENNFELPQLTSGHVRIRPIAVGVCGTDVKIFNKQKPCADGPVGHEATAVVVESLSEKFTAGDFVVVSPHIAEQRETGFYHGNIGYSEGTGVFIKEQILHENRLKLIPSEYASMYSAEALTQADGLACCIRSQKVLNIESGMKAAILGTGTMGILHGQLLKSKGLHVTFIDINPNPLKVAKDLSIGDEYYLTDQVESLHDSFDIVIIANGDPASYVQASLLVNDGGQYNSFAGMFNKQEEVEIYGKYIDVMAYHHEKKPSEIIDFTVKRIKFSGALGYQQEEFDLACEILFTKKIDPTKLITKRISLDENTKDIIIDSYSQGGKNMTYPYGLPPR